MIRAVFREAHIGCGGGQDWKRQEYLRQEGELGLCDCLPVPSVCCVHIYFLLFPSHFEGKGVSAPLCCPSPLVPQSPGTWTPPQRSFLVGPHSFGLSKGCQHGEWAFPFMQSPSPSIKRPGVYVFPQLSFICSSPLDSASSELRPPAPENHSLKVTPNGHTRGSVFGHIVHRFTLT